MEHRFPQNTETEITKNYIHRNEEKDDLEESFFWHKKLEEYKKVQEVLLTFSRTKPKNNSDLRKFLINIAASSTRLLALLEDIPLQETTGCRAKTKAHHRCDEYDKSFTTDQSIPKKINRHLGQKNDEKDEQIPRVSIQRIDAGRPSGEGPRDMSLHEKNNHTMNDKTTGSTSSQCIRFLQENTTQTLLQKDEICNNQLNNETEIVFECKNVEPAITSFAPQKLEYMSQNQLLYSEISEATRAAIKDERLDMVKKEYLDATIEKVNLNNDCETNGQNKIIPHPNSIHDGEESEKLETCSKMLEKNSNLKVHRHTAHKHTTHLCEICGKKFTQKSKLEIHSEVVHNSREYRSRKKSYERGTQGKAFRQKVGQKKHNESPRRSITHTCDTCGKTFKHKSSLKNHIDFVHKNLKHHKCDRCPKEFSCKRGLDFHMSTVHNGITYTCDLCKKIFTRKDTLRIHINIVHMNNRKLFKCDKCQKSFDYKCHLTCHIDDVHKGITHPCDLCEKVFRRKKNLKFHKDSVHKGISYPCDLCEKVFTSKMGLYYHKNSVHKGISYPCDHCRKVFSQKTHLKVHKDSVHKGITQPCDQYKKSFTQKAKLKLHINDVHTDKK